MAGAIFNEAQVEGFAKAGERIGSILQQRWWKKEAEQFQQNEMAQFSAASSQLAKNLSQAPNGDVLAQEINAWNSGVMVPFMTDITAKYASNPIVMQAAQQVFQNASQLPSVLMGAVQQGGKEQRDLTQQQAAEKHEADVDLSRGRAAQAQSEGLLARVKAAQGGFAPSSSAATAQIDPWIPSGTPPTMATTALRRQGTKGFNDARKDDMGLILQDMAAKIHAKRVAGKQRTPEGMAYGADPKAEVEGIKATIPVEAIRKEWEKQKILEHYGPDVLQAMPQYAEDVMPEEAVAPLTGAVTDAQISERMFSPEGALNLNRAGVNTADISELTDNLPDSYQVLPASPMRTVFDVLANEASQQPDGSFDLHGRRFKTYKDLIMMMNALSEALVIEQNIGGIGVPDSGLASDTRSARKKARKLRDAMVEKYAAQVAMQLGIPVPASLKTILGTGAGAELFRGASDITVRSKLGGLLEGLTEGDVEIGR